VGVRYWALFLLWPHLVRKTIIKVSDFILNCSHPQFTLQMLDASPCPQAPGARQQAGTVLIDHDKAELAQRG
jgi:hypothetical protein